MGQFISKKPAEQTYLVGDDRALVISNIIRAMERRKSSSFIVPIEIQNIIYKYCDELTFFEIQYDLSSNFIWFTENDRIDMNFLLVGSVDWEEGGVGTTSLIKRYVDDQFCSQHEMTSDFEYYYKSFVIHSKAMKHTLVRLRLLDPHFVLFHAPYAKRPTQRHDIQSQFYHKADGIMIIFDLTQQESFQFVQQHLEKIKNCAKDDVCKILIGNKYDLYYKREIDPYDVQRFADNNNIAYVETSAKTSLNVQSAFDILIKQVHDAIYVTAKT